MSIIWTEEKIERFKQASAYTAFHKKLAVLVAPFLSPGWKLADMGCGLALLDFELAPYVESITAIDAEEAVVREVKLKIEDEVSREHWSAEKIVPLLAPPDSFGGMQWDVVLLSFFGAGNDTIENYLKSASRRAIIIVHGREPNTKFDALHEIAEPITAAEVETYLDEKGYRYRKSIVELPFGQPFKSIEDIHKFLKNYPGTTVSSDPERLVLSTEDRIIKTDRYDYPYYLPKNISVGIFIVVK